MVRKAANEGSDETILNRKKIQIFGALAAIIAVVLYVGSVIILSSLRPGYSHIRQFVSELGETGAPNAIVMDGVFISVGILVIAFSIGLHKGINEGRGSKVGPAFLVILGIAVIGGGLFPCDPGCQTPESLSGIMHIATGLPAIPATILAPLLISRRLKQDSRWKGYDTLSLAAGIVAIPLLIASMTLFPSSGLAGLGQRFALVVQLGWPLVMAIHLLRLSIK